MSEEPEDFTADQAARANTVLREALGLAPERFGLDRFVGMISDEIDQFRRAGRTDAEISQVLREKAGLNVPEDALSRFYASPEGRHGG
jgi:hypothetical protein